MSDTLNLKGKEFKAKYPPPYYKFYDRYGPADSKNIFYNHQNIGKWIAANININNEYVKFVENVPDNVNISIGPNGEYCCSSEPVQYKKKERTCIPISFFVDMLRHVVTHFPKKLDETTTSVLIKILDLDPSRELPKLIGMLDFRTPELIRLTVESDPSALQFINENEQSPELCELAMNKDESCFRFCKFKTPLCVELATKKIGKNLEYVPDDMKTLENCITCVQLDWCALEYVPDGFKTLELYQAALTTFKPYYKEDFFALVPDAYKKQLYTDAFNLNKLPLDSIPNEYKTLDMCKVGVVKAYTEPSQDKNGYRSKNAIRNVPDDWKKDVCEYLFSQCMDSFEVIPDEFKTQHMCDIAVSHKRRFFLKVPDNLKTKDMCEYANNYIDELRHIDVFSKWSTQQSDKNPEIFQSIPDALKTYTMCEKAIDRCPLNMKYVPTHLKDVQLCKRMFKYPNCSNLATYIHMVPENLLADILYYLIEDKRIKDVQMLLEFKIVLTQEICRLVIDNFTHGVSLIFRRNLVPVNRRLDLYKYALQKGKIRFEDICDDDLDLIDNELIQIAITVFTPMNSKEKLHECVIVRLPKKYQSYGYIFAFEKGLLKFKHIPRELITPQVLENLVVSNYRVLQATPTMYRTADLYLKAVKTVSLCDCKILLKDIPDNCQSAEIYKIVVRRSVKNLKYVPNRYMDSDFLKRAVLLSKKAWDYIPNESKTFDLSIFYLRTYYPELAKTTRLDFDLGDDTETSARMRWCEAAKNYSKLSKIKPPVYV